MCLILFSLLVHPDYPLILAANRDEFLARPSQPAHRWDDIPGLLAGRDVQAGGTWLGVRANRWAALTNFREPLSPPSSSRLSRGALVTDYLSGQESPRECAQRLAGGVGVEYAGYSFLCGQGSQVFYESNRSPGYAPVSPGVHGLSNALLDTPWPKVVRGRAGLGTESEPDALFDLLADERPAPDGDLPDTGVGLALERRLSPLFLRAEGGYGTRCSTILRLDRQGRWVFQERLFLGEGRIQDTRFDLA